MLDDIKNGYCSTEEWLGLAIKKHKGKLNSPELRLYWGLTEDLSYLNYGFGGLIGMICYELVHPIKSGVGLWYIIKETANK